MAESTSERTGEAHQPDQNSRQPKRRIVLFLGTGIFLLAAIAGVLYWLDIRQYESTDDAFIDTQIVRIAPQVAGIVEELKAQPNRHVMPGDLLAIINPDTTETMLKQQQAGVLQALAQTDQAGSQVRVAQAGLAEAQAAVAVPAAAVTKASRDLQRLLSLNSQDSSAVAATQIDAARAALETARAQLNSARSTVGSATAQVESARRAIGPLEAQKEAAQARVNEARLTLGQNQIVAPIAGHIANIAVNTGSYVAPGSQMMALVPDTLWVTANFKETQLVDIRQGQKVDIAIDAYPGVRFTGTVDSVQRGAGQAFQLLPPQNATGNFVKVVQRVPVRILFDNFDHNKYPLGPGMSVVPRIKVR